MSSSNTSFAFPSRAQTLPPEVLDQILSIHFSKKHQGADKIGKGLSLICRNWSGPVQRLLFQSVTVRSVVKLHELGRVKTSLGEVVKSLTVQIEEEGSKWKIRELNDVLETLPRLTSLTLYLNSSSPGYQGSYAAIKQLPNLTALNLQSEKYDSNMVSCRQILAATPNITRLTLGVIDISPRDSYTRPNKSREPIDLPHLTRLALYGVHFCRTFQDLKLFSEGTLERIDDVELDEMSQYTRRMRELSSMPLVDLLAPKVKTLRLGRSGLPSGDHFLMSQCENLETLVTQRNVYHLCIPSTLKIFKYYAPGHYDSVQWLIGTSYQPAFPEGSHLTRVEIYNANPAQNVKDFIVAKGVELVIDGAPFPPPASSLLPGADLLQMTLYRCRLHSCTLFSLRSAIWGE